MIFHTKSNTKLDPQTNPEFYQFIQDLLEYVVTLHIALDEVMHEFFGLAMDDEFIPEFIPDFIDLSNISVILPEFFLGLSVLFLILHCILLVSNKKKKYPIIQKSVIKLCILILIFTFYLISNNNYLLELSVFNSTLINDYMSISAKQCILLSSIIFFMLIPVYLNDQKINSFEYNILILFSVLGLLVICSANDLITLYLGIEIQSLSFYLLAAYKKNSIFSTEAGLKYFILGSFSSGLFLFGASFIYGSTGSTNFNDFKDLFFYITPENSLNLDTIFLDFNLLHLGVLILLISLFFKLALAPFHIWSPDVYEGSLTSSTAFFAIIPKIGIFLALVKFFHFNFYYLFLDDWRIYFIIISVLSIIIGSFTGLEQRKVKSLLAYSSISHMGYSLLAFSIGTFDGLIVLFFYLIVYLMSGLCVWAIFLSVKLKKNYLKKSNIDLSDFSSLVKSNTTLAILFATVVLSIAGFPPLIGFYAKMGVFLVTIESTSYIIALVGILCSVVSSFFYIRLVKVLFFEKRVAGNLYYPINYTNSLIMSICFVLLIVLFLKPTLLYLFCYRMCLTGIFCI